MLEKKIGVIIIKVIIIIIIIIIIIVIIIRENLKNIGNRMAGIGCKDKYEVVVG